MIFFYGFEGLINRFIKVASIELFDWMREVEYKMRRWENMWEDVRLCEKMWDMWEDKRRCEDGRIYEKIREIIMFCLSFAL